MSKDGLTSEEDAVTPRVIEKKINRNTTNNPLLTQENDIQSQQQLTDQIEHLDLIHESKVIFFLTRFKSRKNCFKAMKI